MNKLEIQNAISSCLEKKPITLYDLLNTTIKITSYEIFIKELRFVINTFKNIPEYSKSAQEYLTKMDSFIDSCNFEDKTELENHINSHLHNKICGSYSTQITLQALCSVSINKSSTTAPHAIQQIYDELGYSNLKYYIELINSPSNLTRPPSLGHAKRKVFSLFRSFT